MYNLIFNPPLFYDIPEYLEIVSSHSFWQVFSLGHFPIHPLFLAILWLSIKILPVNAIAMVFAGASLFIFYKIAKLIFVKGNFWIPILSYILLPGVWIISSNLMVESVALTFYLASLYFFILRKKIRFFLFLFLTIGVHLQSVVWLPAIFLFPFILGIKFSKKEFFTFVKYALFSIFLSFVFYFLIYLFSGRVIEGYTEQISVYFSSGFLRMVRNSWLSFIRDFGSLTPFILLFIFLRRVNSGKEKIIWLLFFTLVALVGANWQGDFMGRRIIFAGVPIVLLIYKYLEKKSVFFILYLFPIVAANIILYSKGSPFNSFQIPRDSVLIETHYLYPFTKHNGTILWMGKDDLSIIDGYLKSGKRVFLTEQAITAPYRLLVGNNYHITSLGKIGDSESRFLFRKYIIEKRENVSELKLFEGKKISEEAGNPIFFYNDHDFWGRLARRRIDYGDFGSWLWIIAVNHKDPTGWTYKDVRGI